MEKCKVCGKTYKKITSSHVGTHSLTMEEYNALPDTPEVKETKEEEPTEEPTEEENASSLEDDELEGPKEEPEEESTEKEEEPMPVKKEAEKPLVNCATCGKPILRGQPVIHQGGKAYHGYASCHHSAR